MSTQNKLMYAAFLLLAIILSSCNTKPSLAATSATPTSTLTQSPSPTVTFTPTPSPTATPSPTPALPVNLSTPFPSGLQTITTNNVTNIREIARTGSPGIRGNWFSSDGKLCFVATTDALLVYDLASNQVIKLIDVVISPYESLPDNRLILNSDGNRFAILTNNKIEVWDLNQGLLFELPFTENPGFYQPFKISPDGKILGISKEETSPEGMITEYKIILYDIDRGQILDSQPSFNGLDFFFSPNRTWFLTIESDAVLWRIADWMRMDDITISSRQRFKGFSLDDKLAVIQDNNYVLIYQVEGWKLIRQISLNIKDVYQSSIEFSPDGSKIGIKSENGISVYDIASGERVGDYPKITSLFILSNDGTTIQFQIPDQIYQYLKITLEPEDGFFLGGSKLQYQKDSNELITIQSYHNKNNTQFRYTACTMQLGNTSTCQELSESASINHNGVLYSLHLTDEKNVYEVHRLFGENRASLGNIHSDSTSNYPYWVSSDEKILLLARTTIAPSSVKLNTEIWDLSTGKLIKRWSGYEITHFTYSQDGNTLAFALQKICGYRTCGNDLVVYDASANKVLNTQSAKTNTEFTALNFAPDGKLIYSIGERQRDGEFVHFFVFDPETKDKSELGVSVKVNNYYYFDSMDFSPDGSLLALGLPDGIIRVFDMSTNAEIHSWQAHHGGITNLDFTPDGSLLLSASLNAREGDGYIRAWGIWP